MFPPTSSEAAAGKWSGIVVWLEWLPLRPSPPAGSSQQLPPPPLRNSCLVGRAGRQDDLLSVPHWAGVLGAFHLVLRSLSSREPAVPTLATPHAQGSLCCLAGHGRGWGVGGCQPAGLGALNVQAGLETISTHSATWGT